MNHSSQPTFLFYDLETTGINKAFDQVLQFAAIRTDMDMNELERHEFFIRLRPDVIPSAMATLTHHISIAKANTGMSEYEAVCRIYKLFNSPNTISIGYNSLGFDDEFLRFAFFRNLLPAYNHQFKNGCYRADLYPIVTSYYLFADDVLEWPISDEGKVSLKLENLNHQNALYLQGRAHDAMTDIIVTVELAKKLKAHKPEMWQYLLDRFDKEKDQATMSKLDKGLEIDNQGYPQALMVSGKVGSQNNFIMPVLALGQHRHYKNQTIFLRLDSDLGDDVSVDNIIDKVRTTNKKWGDTPTLLPAKARFMAKFDPQRIAMIKRNKQYFTQHPEVFIHLREHFLEYKYPLQENIDVDASLYSASFMTPEELNMCQMFHKGDIQHKVKMLPRMHGALYQRAVRVIGRVHPEMLPEEAQYEFQAYLESIVSYNDEEWPKDFRGERHRALADVYEEINHLRDFDLNPEQMQLIEELEAYLNL